MSGNALDENHLNTGYSTLFLYLIGNCFISDYV